MARAVLEGVALNARWALEAMVRSLPARPTCAGIVGGGGLFGALLLATSGPALLLTPASSAMFALYLLLMTGVCLLASIVPMRRALRVEATEALSGEG